MWDQVLLVTGYVWFICKIYSLTQVDELGNDFGGPGSSSSIALQLNLLTKKSFIIREGKYIYMRSPCES